MLRVQLRVPDRAGLTLAVLDSLREMLPALAPGELKPENWQVWFARSQVIDGNVGLIVLIARLTVDPVVAKRWSQEKFEDLGRQVRMRSLSKAADRHSQTSSGFRAPEETELSVRLIWTPS